MSEEIVAMSSETTHPPMYVTHRFERIEVRVVKSTIPPHILMKLSESERYMVETLSKVENQYQWLEEVVKKQNEDILVLHARLHILETQGGKPASELGTRITDVVARITPIADKVEKLWDWKQFFSGKWAILGIIVAILAGALAKTGIEFIIKGFKP